MKTKENKKLAVAYCRVSTEEQANQGLSLDVQEEACKTAIRQDGFELLRVIRDEGKSASSLNRAGIQEIISLVIKQGVSAVYAISGDRIARNTMDYLYFRDLLRKNDIELRYVYQPIVDDSAVSRTMDTVMASFNEMQRLVISEKVKKTLSAKAEAGYFPGYAPPGYKNVDNPDQAVSRFAQKIIVPDDMATLITEAFKLYATGNYNGYDLNDLMHEKGLCTKKGEKLSYARFYELLKNRIYIGEVHWSDIHVPNGKHQPLIDRETFNSAQLILSGRNKHACRRRKYTWLLNGFVYCYRHQKRYTAEWHHKKGKAYYHCSNRHGCGKFAEMNALEDKIAEKFKELEFNEDFVDRVISKVKGVFLERRKLYEGKKQAFVNQKTALEARTKVLEDKLLEKVIADEDFTRKRNEIKQELSKIDDRLTELENQHDTKVDVAQEILRFTRDIYDTYKKAHPILKRHYLAFFWERFEVENAVLIKSTLSLLFRELLNLQQVYYKNQNRLELGDSEGIPAGIISDQMLRR